MSHKSERIFKELLYRNSESNTRRNFLRDCTIGLGGLALGGLTSSCKGKIYQSSADIQTQFLANKMAQFAPRAKSIIYLHMAGAPSQLELFDYKPELAKMDGQLCPPSVIEGKKFAFIRGVPTMLGPQASFKQQGQSGAWMSNLVPNLSEVVDDLCFLKGMHTDQFNHAPAQLLMQTGGPRPGRPCMGSWVTYGLGSMNEDLPSFVVLTSGGYNPDAGKSIWGSGFLPSVYQGVQCRSKGDPILFLEDPKGMNRDVRKASIEAINKINREEYNDYRDPETLSRIKQYELAYRMQIAVPDVMDIGNEPSYIHEMYGTKPGKESFANNLLLARRLVEKGVRFVQLYDWGWDSHGTDQSTDLGLGFKKKCLEMDQPVAALIKDLKQRGLLEDTLVVWGGEFGRTPMSENREGVQNAYVGRDHHIDAFTMWMAGGGVKAGYTYGETDEIGYNSISGAVSTFDLQATILHQLGFDHEQMTFQFQGRPFRLTDVEGRVINEIIS